MTRENAKQLLPIIKAWSEGECVQFLLLPECKWVDVQSPMFSDPTDQYRIKPQPREFFAVLYNQQGLVGGLYDSEVQAANYNKDLVRNIIRVREVIP